MAAEAAVSTAVLKLADLLSQKANFLKGGIIGEIQKLKDELKGVQCFLRDAEVKQANDVAIRDWISETREVAHDAEDAVEVFIFKVERAKMMLGSFTSSLNHKYHLTKFNRSIKSIRKRLRGIEVRRLNHGIQDLADRRSDGVESSKRSRRLCEWQKDKHVVGMEKDVEQLFEKAIFDEGEEALSVSAIVGVGGVGKSTLARIFHNHPAVADRFERRAWVVASNEIRPRDILTQLYFQVESSEAMEWQIQILEKLELEEIRQRIYKRLKGKRCLIVLDDVWDKDHWKDALGGALPDEGTCSRFLLTTRIPDLEDDSQYIHTMKCLDSKEGWMLFLNTVSDGKSLEGLEETGRQIADICEGLPLAIILVGGLLMKQNSSKTGWQKVLEDMKSHLNRSNIDTIQTVLELSYQNLPPPLKPCFLCLGLFKVGETIITQKLVDLWISEGLISEEGGRTMEETAMAYLEELVDRNMVKIKDISMDEQIKSCVMHDLVRDLSIKKAEDEMKLDEDGKSESSEKPRHRVLDCSEGRFSDSIYGNKHVRSLVVRGAKPYLFTTSFSSYWQSFQLLRVLDFECCVLMTQLPISISALIGLRYLNLRNTRIENIPNWLPRLINLEVLDLRGLVSTELSDIFGKMCRLRRLYASAFYFEKPPVISSLKFLHKLSYVNFDDSDVEQVTHMTSLCELGINMFRITDSWRLLELLGEMENLVHLKLKYCYALDLDGLGALQRVTRLKLHGEMPVLPSNLPPNLSHLSLVSCQLKEDPMGSLQSLPKLSHLKLDKAKAYDGKGIVVLRDGFPALQVLVLCSLNGLVSLRVEEGAMPELRRMEIKRCLSLEEMGGMRNLEELRIVGSKKIATKLRGEDSHMISSVPYVQIMDDFRSG